MMNKDEMIKRIEKYVFMISQKCRQLSLPAFLPHHKDIFPYPFYHLVFIRQSNVEIISIVTILFNDSLKFLPHFSKGL